MAYNMSRRTSEIGIRMALGARPDDIRRLALGESLRLTGAGVMVGIPGALAAGRLVRGLLYGIRATDPWVLGAAALVMIAVAPVGRVAAGGARRAKRSQLRAATRVTPPSPTGIHLGFAPTRCGPSTSVRCVGW
jgi:ABC-type antimicrobial peptide transport system permease subunit